MSAYSLAQECYASLGVNTENALATLSATPISLHCWQGDDVGGFERAGAELDGGGIQATGHYPGKPRSLKELREDLDQVLRLLPGRHRLNLHACYADLGGRKVDRNAYGVAEFQSWIDWCGERSLGLDFNPSFFSHPLAAEGRTLSHPRREVRDFWIEHGIACRRIGAEAGRQLGSPTVTNVWIPDGSKDLPVDRMGPRELLAASLDKMFAEELPPEHLLDAVESKLFGIGSESYVVGSHEFYLGYAITRRKMICLDAGHFHPTENLGDKISSVLQFVPRILLHVSRGVRWDSDHVVLLDDATRGIMEEVVRGDFLDRTHLGLDFFDASINRLAAWVLGTRSALKALLMALLEPVERLRCLEAEGDFTRRLVLMEEAKTLPWQAVWEEHCRRCDVPAGFEWMEEVRRYEGEVLSQR